MFLEHVSKGLLRVWYYYQTFSSYYYLMYVEGFILQHTLETGVFFFSFLQAR